MSRCIICNYSQENDRPYKKVVWVEKEQGFVCDPCSGVIADTFFDFDDGCFLDESEEINEYDAMARLTFLEVREVERD